MVWRIDNPSTVPTLPAIPAPATEAFYSDGNEVTGVAATVVDAWWLNMIQEEIRNVVVAAGIAPNKHDNTQLLAAISAITGGNIWLPLAGGTMTGQIFFNTPNGIPDPDPDVSGLRLSLWNPGDAGLCDYAIGVGPSELWFGVPATAEYFGFYAGTALMARIPPNANPVQPYDLITLAYLQANSRQVLSGNHIYHVATPAGGGSDTTGDGSTANPWATVDFAVTWVQENLDVGGHTVTIEVADGIYNDPIPAAGALIGATGPGQLVILGNSGDNTAVVFHCTGADCLDVQAGASIWIKDITLQSTASGGAGGNGLTASYAGELLMSNCNFGACSGNHMYAAAGGSIIVMGSYSISGGAQCHAQAATEGYIEMSSYPDRGVHLTISGNPNFSGGFTVAGAGSISAANNSFTGSATGPRYDAHLNGVIFTNNHGASYFPGSVAGSVSTGGQYG